MEPNHPGIIHYLIHTYDYPGLAILALPAARRYAEVAPSSAHALHMPSHIFTRLGLWDDAICMLTALTLRDCHLLGDTRNLPLPVRTRRRPAPSTIDVGTVRRLPCRGPRRHSGGSLRPSRSTPRQASTEGFTQNAGRRPDGLSILSHPALELASAGARARRGGRASGRGRQRRLGSGGCPVSADAGRRRDRLCRNRLRAHRPGDGARRAGAAHRTLVALLTGGSLGWVLSRSPAKPWPAWSWSRCCCWRLRCSSSMQSPNVGGWRVVDRGGGAVGRGDRLCSPRAPSSSRAGRGLARDPGSPRRSLGPGSRVTGPRARCRVRSRCSV